MDIWLVAALAAFIPAVLWLVFFYRRDKFEREPTRAVLKFFLLGSVVAVPATLLLVGLVVMPILDGLSLQTGDLIGLFVLMLLVAGLPEETIKGGIAGRWARREADVDEPVDGMVYFTSLGLGFGALETVLYIVGTYFEMLPAGGEVAAFDFAVFGVGALRALTATVGHGLWTGIIGFFYARRRFSGGGWGLLSGIVVAAVVHSAYNAAASYDFVLAVGVLIATAVGYFALFNSALRRSPHAGVLGRPGTPPTA